MINENGVVINTKTGNTIQPDFHKNGYVLYHLSFEGKRYRRWAYRLVADAFNPLRYVYEDEVNHIDGNKTNNSISNLEWCTHMRNMKHFFDIKSQADSLIRYDLSQIEKAYLMKEDRKPIQTISRETGIIQSQLISILYTEKIWGDIVSEYSNL